MSNTNFQKIKIAVIGDVHNHWENEDNKALQALGVDLVLFVGDLGNESVNIISIIAEIKIPKAVILGNHDAWYTASSMGRKKSPYDHNLEDRVTQQLDILGKNHVGYNKLDFPQFNLSIVGSRPFTWGGNKWKNKTFLRERFGVNNFEDSVSLIVEKGKETQFENIIFLGHNGPFGLGDQPEDPCGKDWKPLGGDYGDPDFTEAITTLKKLGKKIPLVTFGHMHHRLRHTQERQRIKVKKIDHTIYLNSASVPRIKKINHQFMRNFSLVTLENYQVTEINLVWINPDHEIIEKEIIV